jgi:hypothetical protein
MTLGVYLLGALDPAERSAFESHLSSCDPCRGELVRLAPLPGLLNQITPEDFADDLPPTGAEATAGAPGGAPAWLQPVTEPVPLPVPPPVPPPLPPVGRDPRDPYDPRDLPGTPDTPGPDDRSEPKPPARVWRVAAAAAVVLVLTIGGVFGWRALREDVPPPRAEGVTWSVTAADGSAHADARLVGHEWGTEIQSRLEGLPPGRKCYLVVYDHYGNREIAGWWGTDHDPDEEIPASTSFQLAKIERLVFKLDEETVALTIQAPAR